MQDPTAHNTWMMLTISCLACVIVCVYNIYIYDIIISYLFSFSSFLCVVCMYNMYTTCIFGAWSWRSQGQWYCILLCSLVRDPTAGWKSGQQSESNGRVNPTRSAPGATLGFQTWQGLKLSPYKAVGLPWFVLRLLLVGRSTSKFQWGSNIQGGHTCPSLIPVCSCLIYNPVRALRW